MGEPGKGKSELTTLLVADLMTFENKTYEPDSIYTVKVENEYKEGYTGQYAWVYDDWGQSTDDEIRKLETLEVIYAVNQSPWQLHMAEMSKKASTYFLSEVVILNTNKQGFADLPVTEPNAFLRRVHVCFLVDRDMSNDETTQKVYEALIGTGADPDLAAKVAPLRLTVLDRFTHRPEEPYTNLNYFQAAKIIFQLKQDRSQSKYSMNKLLEEDKSMSKRADYINNCNYSTLPDEYHMKMPPPSKQSTANTKSNKVGRRAQCGKNEETGEF
jgi:hypothetical protein